MRWLYLFNSYFNPFIVWVNRIRLGLHMIIHYNDTGLILLILCNETLNFIEYWQNESVKCTQFFMLHDKKWLPTSLEFYLSVCVIIKIHGIIYFFCFFSVTVYCPLRNMVSPVFHSTSRAAQAFRPFVQRKKRKPYVKIITRFSFCPSVRPSDGLLLFIGH